MDNRIEQLFQEWHRLGGAVLLAQADPTIPVRPPEEVLAESTAHCRASGRLTWVVLDWLIRHIEEIDEQPLLQKTAECGELSVLGVLCDAAHQRRPHPKFERLMRACTPHRDVVPFFHRVARNPLASRLTRENAVDVFRRWNYLCSELRYLEDAPSPKGDSRPSALRIEAPKRQKIIAKDNH
jgi:hypothetical protein